MRGRRGESLRCSSPISTPGSRRSSPRDELNPSQRAALLQGCLRLVGEVPEVCGAPLTCLDTAPAAPRGWVVWDQRALRRVAEVWAWEGPAVVLRERRGVAG